MDRFICLILFVVCFLACGDKDSPDNGGETGGETGGVTDVTPVTSNLIVNLSTDKACYKPGEAVIFTADQIPGNTKIRYRYLNKVIEEKDMTAATWTWTPPAIDFRGYMADLYQKESNGTEVIVGVIAVDVSSDWTRFPRYGFVAAFGGDKTEDKIKEEMAYLNRHHINGVQFQDWHNKHHWPLGGSRDKLDETYKDIANRTIYTSTVKNYIKVQHGFGMKSIFYNLCFGALNDAKDDGVKEEWYVFMNTDRTGKDSHQLPSSWKSDIYLLDPANTEWQEYIAQRNDDVYANIAFDGYQIDQLGNRGIRYDYSGRVVNFPRGYASFINAMKEKHPDKRLVMNAVSSYGGQQIAETGKVDFLYNEVWGDESEFKNLRSIIYANNVYGKYELKTVFAAYMNYNVANNKGLFNTPGVLLADAVMFALGGAHLELGGDHMLCKEYFPNDNLSMKEDLIDAMVHYYDFLTGYQNFLRDGGTENELEISCTNSRMNLAVWVDKQNPQTGKVATLAKIVEGKQVIHLLNFTQANSVSWRDLNGDMPEPRLISDAILQFNAKEKISKIWTASPDAHGGASRELAFKQENGVVTFTLPSLKYWTMLVLEYN